MTTCKLPRHTHRAQVFAALEDNVVTLSTMKASRYFTVFEREILYWEQALSLVSEAIETILQVQGERPNGLERPACDKLDAGSTGVLPLNA
jgi:hypothetical protein